MKKILTLIALICASQFCFAQSDSTYNSYKGIVDTMKVVFTAPVGTCMYVAHYLEDDAGISLQVAIATRGIDLTDSVLNNDNIKATVVIKGALVVKCFEVLRNVPEGYGADQNKMLMNALMPTIVSNPAFAYVIMQLKAFNDSTVLQIKQAGAARVHELQKIIE